MYLEEDSEAVSQVRVTKEEGFEYKNSTTVSWVSEPATLIL
jgi:hypothetical protein